MHKRLPPCLLILSLLSMACDFGGNENTELPSAPANTVVSCVGKWGHCSSSGDCCGELSCDANKVCNDGGCVGQGAHCAQSANCCGTLTCSAGLCTNGGCFQQGAHCSSYSQCCGTLTCNSDGVCSSGSCLGA